MRRWEVRVWLEDNGLYDDRLHDDGVQDNGLPAIWDKRCKWRDELYGVMVYNYVDNKKTFGYMKARSNKGLARIKGSLE